MPFQVKDWKNAPDPSTPLSAEAMEDTEQRVGSYVDQTLVQGAKGHVVHGTNAATARPGSFASIEWYGSVQPTNMQPQDSWRTVQNLGSGGGGSSGQDPVDMGAVSGTVQIDMSGSVNRLVRCRVTAATTFSIVNLANAAWCELRVQQPTASAANVTWPTGLWAGGVIMVHTPTANAVDRVAYQGNPTGTPDAFVVGNNFRTAL